MMIKKDELSNPKSCLNKARDDEALFVLLERDPAFEATINFWIEERIRLELNKEGDDKIESAKQLILNVATRRDNASN